MKAEIARDKEIRRLNKGVLPSVLGVEGYNPSIIQYDVPASAPAPSAPPAAPVAAKDSLVPAKRGSDEITSKSTSPTAPPAKMVSPAQPASAPKKASTTASSSSGADSSPQTPEQRIDAAITTLMRYRTGGDGGNALKLLLTFTKNIADHPEDPK